MNRRSHNKNPNLKYLTIFVLTLVILGIPSYIWTKKNVTSLACRYHPTVTPVIMIPGTSADATHFDNLISTVNQQYNEHHSLLRVTVGVNNQISYSGNYSTKDKHPFVTIGFENSQDGYSNIKKQAAWLNIAFKDLKNKYHFNNFNIFGHSNGGLIWTYYLENYFKKSPININRMMTVGTPYNLESSDKDHTQMLKDLISQRQNIPTEMTYYSIAGTKHYEDDGIVPLSSVSAGKYIYEDQIKNYTLVVLTGSNAEHSDMLANYQFITLFHQYFIKNTLQKNSSQ